MTSTVIKLLRDAADALEHAELTQPRNDGSHPDARWTPNRQNGST